MSKDLRGLRPTDIGGWGFSNSLPNWDLLWHYCATVAPDIIPEDMRGAGNIGCQMSPEAASRLADRLREEIASGRCAAYAAEFARARQDLLAQYPSEPCPICGGQDAADGEPLVHRPDCLICGGSGAVYRAPFLIGYFAVENVEAFAAFLSASGGVQFE